MKSQCPTNTKKYLLSTNYWQSCNKIRKPYRIKRKRCLLTIGNVSKIHKEGFTIIIIHIIPQIRGTCHKWWKITTNQSLGGRLLVHCGTARLHRKGFVLGGSIQLYERFKLKPQGGGGLKSGVECAPSSPFTANILVEYKTFSNISEGICIRIWFNFRRSLS